MPALELGLGYATGAARVEMLVEYRPDFAFEGRANFLARERRQSVAADLSSVSGMLAGLVDLAGLGLPRVGPLAPFIGAGIGVVHTRIGKTTMTFPGDDHGPCRAGAGRDWHGWRRPGSRWRWTSA